jgi:hypothetical protein
MKATGLLGKVNPIVLVNRHFSRSIFHRRQRGDFWELGPSPWDIRSLLGSLTNWLD